jgi:hypothetical protein
MFNNWGRKDQVLLIEQLLNFLVLQTHKKNDEHQWQFLEDLIIYTCKGYKLLSIMKTFGFEG